MKPVVGASLVAKFCVLAILVPESKRSLNKLMSRKYNFVPAGFSFPAEIFDQVKGCGNETPMPAQLSTLRS